MSDIFFRVLKFVRKIVDSVGIGNFVLIAFALWFIHTPMWVRLKVLLGVATDEEKKALEVQDEEKYSGFADNVLDSDASAADKVLDGVQKSNALLFYASGCYKKGLIPAWKYWLYRSPIPILNQSNSTLRKYKYMYENNVSEADYDSTIGRNGGHF